MSAAPISNDDLRKLIESVGGKLDDLVQRLPNIYIPRLEHDPWRVGMENRLTVLETEIKTGKVESMKAYLEILEKIAKSEERLVGKQEKIIEKIDAGASRTWEQRLGVILATVGWFVTLAVFILSYIVSHPH